MNAISLSGRLTHDPKLVYRADRPICEMRLAVDNGRHPTTFIDVRTFDGQAYVCAEYMRKGSKVAVSGTLAYSEWRGAEDKKRERYSVIGRVEFLDPPPAEEVGESIVPAPKAPEPELALAA
jgi:single-strand DNA-binding protein